jgi:hypothetical protein
LKGWRLRLVDGTMMGKRRSGGWLNLRTEVERVMEEEEEEVIMEVARIGRVVEMG